MILGFILSPIGPVSPTKIGFRREGCCSRSAALSNSPTIKIGAELQPAAGRGPAEDEETNQDMAGIHL